MKLLFALVFLAFTISGCESTKMAESEPSNGEGTSSVAVSVVIEMSAHENNLNDVLSICNGIKPCQSFNLNYMSQDRMELRLVYLDLSESQRNEIYSQLNRSGLGLLTIKQH